MHLLKRKTTAAPNNLKIPFLVVSILVLSVILSGQWILHDFYEQEHDLIHQLNDEGMQFELVNNLMNDLAILVSDDNENTDYILSRLMDNYQQLERLHNTVFPARPMLINKETQRLVDNNMRFSERLIEHILVLASSVIGNMQDQISLQNQYQSLLHDYDKFQNNHRLITVALTEIIEQYQHDYRQIFLVITVSVSVLFLLIAFLFYRWLSHMLNRQLAILKQKNLLQKQAYEKQLEHEQRMTSILESTVDAIITISHNGIIETFNCAAELMFGYAAKDIIGENIKILMPASIARQHDNFLKRYRESGESAIIGTSVEVNAKRVDGREFPVLLSISEVKLPTGNVYTGILHDLSERKKKEQQLQQLTKELLEKQSILEQEEKIARHVFENITVTNNGKFPEVGYWSVPLRTFSGDLMLSTTLPDGGIRILLCDFTGHGLPAALGAVPVSSIFHAMSQKGLSLNMLMDELNEKLKGLLPTGMFCCISAVELDANRHHTYIWNAGLPAMLLISENGQIKQRFSSRHLPLGVMKYSQDELMCEDSQLETGDAIYIFTDGLSEAENEAGQMLGQAGIEQLLACPLNEDGRLPVIQQKINQVMDKSMLKDDLSIIEIKILGMDEELTLKS